MYPDIITPPYMKFGDLEEAEKGLASIKRADYSAENFVISEEGKLSFDLQGSKGTKSLPFMSYGMDRMLNELKIPRAFAYKVVDNQLLTHNINELIQLVPDGQVMTEVFEGQEFIAGFHKQFIQPLRDLDFIKALRNHDALQNSNIRHFVRSPHKMRFHYFYPTETIPGFVDNDAISFGGDFVYSEYGIPLSVNLALLIQVCTNGATLTDEFLHFHYKHAGDRVAAKNALDNALYGLVNPENLEGITERLQMMNANRPSEKYLTGIINKMKRLEISDGLAEALDNRELSFMQIFNEVTRVAHTSTFNPDDRIKLEMLGGRMLSDVKIYENRELLNKPISVN